MLKALPWFAMLSLSLASTAHAQGTPAAPLTPARPPIQRLNSDLLRWDVDRNQAGLSRRERRKREREILAKASDVRRDRADRVAGLLNQGKCAEAYAVAAGENDADMAVKVKSLCR